MFSSVFSSFSFISFQMVYIFDAIAIVLVVMTAHTKPFIQLHQFNDIWSLKLLKFWDALSLVRYWIWSAWPINVYSADTSLNILTNDLLNLIKRIEVLTVLTPSLCFIPALLLLLLLLLLCSSFCSHRYRFSFNTIQLYKYIICLCVIFVALTRAQERVLP